MMKKNWPGSRLLNFLALSAFIGVCLFFYQFAERIEIHRSYFSQPLILIMQDMQRDLNHWVFQSLVVGFFFFVFIRLLKKIFTDLVTRNVSLNVKIINKDKFTAALAAFCLIGSIGYFGAMNLPAIKTLLYKTAVLRNFYKQIVQYAYASMEAAGLVLTGVFVSAIVLIVFLLSRLLSKAGPSRIWRGLDKFKSSKMTNFFRGGALSLYKALVPVIVFLFIIVNVSTEIAAYFFDSGMYRKGPNVILVTIDTLRHDHVGCYGYRRNTTPHIDRFAHESSLFKEAISPIPLTYPSHTSILSGLYPAHHGVINNWPIKISRDIDLLPLELKKRGYETAAFVSGWTLHSKISDLKKYFDLYDDGMQGSERRAEETTKAAIRWLRRNHHTNIFLWVHYFDPHSNYNPPEEYIKPFSHVDQDHYILYEQLTAEEKLLVAGNAAKRQQVIDQYDGEIAYDDHCFGQLMDELKALNLYKNSVIIVTSDHGESLTEHHYYFDHSEDLYDPCLRVPLIVKKAYQTDPSVIEVQVGLIDIMPTVLELSGIAYEKESLDGKSLVRLMEGKAPEWDRVYYAKIFKGEIEGNKTLSAIRKQHEKAIITKPWWSGRVLMEGKKELYDLQTDPGESKDLSDIYKERLGALRQNLDSWETANQSPGRNRGEGRMTRDMKEKLRSLGYIH